MPPATTADRTHRRRHRSWCHHRRWVPPPLIGKIDWAGFGIAKGALLTHRLRADIEVEVDPDLLEEAIAMSVMNRTSIETCKSWSRRSCLSRSAT